MPKVTLTDITNITGQETSAINTLNNNWQSIETGFENTLSRDGTSPNTMSADIDLNENDLLNVGLTDTERLILDGVEFFTDDVLAKGDAATVTVGTVTTGAAGTSVIITNSGDEHDAVLNFTIPRGDTGAAGAGTGDMLSTNNLSDVANAATAFTNIKQAATTSATGVVELATDAETQTGTDTARAITPANLTAKEASIAEYRAKTPNRIMTSDVVFNAMAPVTLTDASTIAWNLASGYDFVVTLGGNRTLGNPTNVTVGQRGRIKVIQDGTGGHTLTKSSNHKLLNGAAITIASAAGAITYIDYDVVSSTEIRLSVSGPWS